MNGLPDKMDTIHREFLRTMMNNIEEDKDSFIAHYNNDRQVANGARNRKPRTKLFLGSGGPENRKNSVLFKTVTQVYADLQFTNTLFERYHDLIVVRSNHDEYLKGKQLYNLIVEVENNQLSDSLRPTINTIAKTFSKRKWAILYSSELINNLKVITNNAFRETLAFLATNGHQEPLNIEYMITIGPDRWTEQWETSDFLANWTSFHFTRQNTEDWAMHITVGTGNRYKPPLPMPANR